MTNEQLKTRQDECEALEKKMIEYMLQYDACQKMTIGDVKYIASLARSLAFDAMKVAENKGAFK
jgi:hypothetical protein